MKTIIKYMFISALSLQLFSGCNSLLDVEIKHALPQEKVKTESGCEGLLIGVYDQLRAPEYFGREMICIPDILADNFKISSSASRYTGQYNFQPYYNMDIWTVAYQQIGTLNEIILYTKDLEATSKAKAIRGEALFLRAFNYFYLSMVYSRVPNYLVGGFDLGVPLVLEPFINQGGDISVTASPKRAKATEVWTQIETDLKESYNLLNGNDNGLFPYRVSSLAVKAFLSRVYLYLGKWDDCITASKYVIDNANIPLYSGTYTDIFSKGKESLFELKYTTAENLGPSSLQAIYAIVDNGYRDSEGYSYGTGSGEADVEVSSELFSLFDQAKDTRFEALRKAIYMGQKVWWTDKFNSWGGVFGLDNVPVIRISEMYLNRAEAYANKTSYTESRADINALRTSRGLTETSVANGELLNEVLLQRRIELAFEGHRFFDFKRQGKPILRPQGKDAIPYTDYRVVAPISITELDVNKNLVNNPGY